MWSTPDLSNVTVVLKGLLDQAVQNSGLAVGNIAPISCDSPETVRDSGSQCYLTLYLLHVGRDPFWRNAPVSGPRPRLNPAQPLSLNLSYLLTAYCKSDFTLEQRAMSIALQAIHSNPIMNASTTAPPIDLLWPDLPNGEFVVSIEADTIEEMSRLWQAFTVPIRLSALIKASVIFVSPIQPSPPPDPPPSTVNLAVAPVAVAPTPTGMTPTLWDGYAQQTPPLPDGTALAQLAPTGGPLVAVGAQAPAPGTSAPLFDSMLIVAGNALDQPDAANVYLSAPGSSVWWDITTWRQAVVPPATNPPAGELDLLLPPAYADPGGAGSLAAMPPPGLYNLAVGSGGSVKSNVVTIAVAPRVDHVANPPQLFAAGSGVFTVSGAGFMPATGVTLALGAASLSYSTAATPPAGGFTIDPAGATISFMAPTVLAAGTYPLLLAVNGIAASIGWLAVVT